MLPAFRLPHFTPMEIRRVAMPAFLFFGIVAQVVAAADLPLPPPVQCNGSSCTISYYQHIWTDRTPCKAAMAVYPKSEQELMDAVAYASKTQTKVKVASKGCHSVPKLVCPGGDHGLIISTKDFNSHILVNATQKTVTVDAGVTLRPFIDHLAEHGLTIPHTPYWEGVSVGGMISTGAHGSGMWGTGSSPHDYVIGMRLIIPASPEEGYAKLIDLGPEDPDLNAARLSIGVLGAISQITFKLEPLFKRSVTLEVRDDHNLEEDILQFAKKNEFGGFNWYPSSKKGLFKRDNRVSIETEGDGAYDLALVAKIQVQTIEAMAAAAMAPQSTEELCAGAEKLLQHRHVSGDGLINTDNEFVSYPVVGFNHKMQTAGDCDRMSAPVITATGISDNSDDENMYGGDMTDTGKLVTCMWNPLIRGFFYFDIALSVPASRISEVIADVKKLGETSRTEMCAFGHLGGIWIRFLRGSTAYLGQRGDAVVFEIVYPRSKDGEPNAMQHVMEEIEQMLLVKYKARPHWGKNRDLAFEGMGERTVAMDKFLEARARFDPKGLFSSEWSDAILGISSASAPSRSVQIYRDRCALEGLCICEEDTHCHPSKGYFCRPGRLYTEARVCRQDEVSSSTL